ncbi:hypothetical protein B0T10DRAFT_561077 [Thelonectria olida]|uniref:Uncharacterized protein n=1 Tax=Thelonectria olida TaxID=1576542 RepID=A0A9P8W5B5_9HYPO|nr:hypothetical protein B0T10DRAFT_561077 [Thelonectria olida]
MPQIESYTLLRLEDLPVTKGFEPKNYENARASLSISTRRQPKNRAFCKPGDGASPEAHPLFQSLMVTFDFTWPKWMILAKLYGDGHYSLRVMGKIITAKFGHSGTRLQPRIPERGENLLQALLQSIFPGGNARAERRIQVENAITEKFTRLETPITSRPSRSVAESISEEVQRDLNSLSMGHYEPEASSAPEPATLEPAEEPISPAQFHALVSRVEAVEAKNQRLEELIDDYTTVVPNILRHLKFSTINIPETASRMSKAHTRLVKLSIRVDRLSGRIRKFGKQHEIFPPKTLSIERVDECMGF